MKIQHVRSAIQVQVVHAIPELIVKFTEQDVEVVNFSYDDAMVVSFILGHVIVNRIIVYNDIVVNLLQLSVIQKMPENTGRRKAEVLTRFNGLTIIDINTITLDVSSTLIVSSQIFMIVSDLSFHDGILGEPWLVKIKAVT